jgi:hypothetical protein
MDYFLMGGGRSLSKLHKMYVEATSNKPPTKHLRILAGWSTRHHWQARIAQQNANDNAIALEEYRLRHMSKEEVIARLSDQARGDMGTFGNVRTQADLAKHPNSELVKSITQHYNQVEKGTGENKKTELKARITLGLYDAQKALELLARHHGLFEADNKSEINVSVEESPRDKLTGLLAGYAANAAETDDTGQTD